MQDRRKTNRVLYKQTVTLTLQDGQQMMSTSQDFSMAGIGLMSHTHIPVGETIAVTLRVNSSKGWRNVQLDGEIVHSEQTTAGYKSGVRFHT